MLFWFIYYLLINLKPNDALIKANDGLNEIEYVCDKDDIIIGNVKSFMKEMKQKEEKKMEFNG